ncbi:DUF418 domain-containing protein [Paenibacillus dauci]|uniref:DUF418 domain-containing protein n=1 Tax=Paenibacillus dauci TaxID=1567106 RepID=UPI00061A04FE|nr:DUF418 domain-containing protein [Paenibacillus dauci]
MEKEITSIESNQRIQVLDQLRGFALLLIFLMNLPALSRISFHYTDTLIPALRDDSVLTNFLLHLLRLLFENSSRPLFAFMFGISMVLIYDNVKRRGKNPFFTLFRRMFVLMLIGYIHFSFIWHGDILLMYALAGFILLLFISMSAWPLLLFTLLSTLLFNEMQSGILMYIDEESFNLSEGIQFNITHMIKNLFWWGTDYSFDSNPIVKKLLYQFQFVLPHLFFFLAGMLAYRLNIFGRLPRYRVAGWMIAIVLLAAGIYGKKRILDIETSFWALDNENLINFSVSLGIAFVIILMSSSRRMSILTRPFAAVGRMAFTNYLLQSLVFVSIFIPSGESFFRDHGLINQMPYTILLLLSLIFFGLQMWGSHIWLRHFHYGPFEWLWRWGTNLKLPPMRRKLPAAKENT